MLTGKGKTSPLITVIIPTYNRAPLLSEAVESVLNQRFKDFELIIVDDGSTDNTERALARYRDAVILLQQKNRGVSAARNLGIKAAKGEWIAFLDSDDLWLPEKLERQVDYCQTHRGISICQTEEIWIRNGVRVNPGTRHKKPSGNIFIPSLALCLVSPSAVMIKKALFDEVGLFEESFPACEDYDLWLRISCRYPIFLIETPLVVKRGGHPDQLSRMPGLDQYRIESIRRLLEQQTLPAGSRAAAIRTLVEKCAIYASGCRKRGRVEEARYYENLAEKYDGNPN